MSEGKRMTPLELRKRALEMESELNRLELRGELHRLREQFKWVPALGGMTQGRRTAKVLVGLAGAGLAVGAWRQRRMIRRAVRLAALARPAFGLVRRLGIVRRLAGR